MDVWGFTKFDCLPGGGGAAGTSAGVVEVLIFSLRFGSWSQLCSLRCYIERAMQYVDFTAFADEEVSKLTMRRNRSSPAEGRKEMTEKLTVTDS